MLNLEFAHGRSGVQPTVENLPKDCHGSGGFLRCFLLQNAKEKSAEKIREPNTKNPPARDPPKDASQAQNSAAKPTNKSAC